MTSGTPRTSGGNIAEKDPSKCTGETHRARSSAVYPMASAHDSTAAIKAAGGICTPLGTPVVPDVKMMWATGPTPGVGVGPPVLLNVDRVVHAVPAGSPDGSVWSAPAVITCAGRQSATICARRISGSVTASGTNVAPAHRQPSAATTKSTELPISRATRSPGPTPF